MSVPVATGLTYADLAAMPEPGVDGLREELIDGELYVTPAPIRRHQDAVLRIAGALLAHVDRRVDDTGRYGTPTTSGPADTLTCAAAPGFALRVGDVLA